MAYRAYGEEPVLVGFDPDEPAEWTESAYPPPDKPRPLNYIGMLQIAGRLDRDLQQLGNDLFEDGCVFVEKQLRCEAFYQVADADEDVEHRVHLWANNSAVYFSCTCPRTKDDPKLICEHKQAAYLQLTDSFRPSWASSRPTWEDRLKDYIPGDKQRTVVATQVLVFSVIDGYGGWTVIPFSLPLSTLGGVDVTDVDALCDAIRTRQLSDSAKAVTQKIDPDRYVNIDDVTGWIAQAAQMAHREYSREVKLPLDRMFRALKNAPLFTGSLYHNPLQQRVIVDEEAALPVVRIGRERRVMVVDLVASHHGVDVDFGNHARVVCEKPVWILSQGRLFPLAGAGPAFAAAAMGRPVRVPIGQQERFIREYLPRFIERCDVRTDLFQWDEVDTDPQPRLYLREVAGELVVELRHDYHGLEVPAEKVVPAVSILLRGRPQPVQVAGSSVAAAERQPHGPTSKLARIHRHADAEAQWYQLASKHSLKRGPSFELLALKSRVEPVDFLIHEVPRLAEAGFEIFGEEDLKLVRVNRNRPRLDFTVTSGIDWLDLHAVVSFGDIDVSLKEIGKAIRKKERFIKLADGSIGAIPPEWIERYRHLFAFAEETEKGLRVSNTQIGIVEAAIELADGVNVDKEFEERRERLRDFSSIGSKPLPNGLKAELRPYQVAGYEWLHFLHDYGFGGCLADDMGIGKTVQTLALLLSLKETGAATAANLIVVPKSLLFNWERESKRFTPGLRVLVYSENKRTKKSMHFEDYDLVITTYGVMMRDAAILKEYRFHYVVLDESQAIKNPASLTGKAARSLVSDHRLVLTGTPVENSTVELWSQFAFACPGLLGGIDYFRQEFASAIEKTRDVSSAQLLRRMVFPFILRRTKDQVAPELPPRTERILLAEMEDDQRALYETTRDRYRNELLNLISSEGMNAARMRILEALLRLRQIANHPRLVDKESTVSSGKFELLRDTLETLKAEGHKALVFSQFVQMLTIVRQDLDELQVPYAYLDGQTRDRQTRVDEFQADANIPFFLISLKAGGVGLNLTAADYVIHIDPWWNPAVERQATDRTHRIGQNKPVFVYKLITHGTVEEKILDLQDRKKALVEQIITTEESFFKSLTTDDVDVLFR